MPKFIVEFQLNNRGAIPITAASREDAEETVRLMIENGSHEEYLIRSDSFIEAY